MSEFELKREGDRVRLALQGDFTASAVPEVRTALLKVMQEGATEVEFDFEKTTVIDSTGIGLLIATYNSLAQRNGLVRAVGVSDDIFRLLQSMRLEKRLNVSAR